VKKLENVKKPENAIEDYMPKQGVPNQPEPTSEEI